MECEFPSVNATSAQIKGVLSEIATIAVVGLSPDSSKDSYRVAEYLQSVGYLIIPIYPKSERILGQIAYPSLADVPANVRIDMVNVFRKPEAVLPIAQACIARGGVRVLWTQKGIVNNAAAALAEAAGIMVVQNKCAMVEHRLI